MWITEARAVKRTTPMQTRSEYPNTSPSSSMQLLLLSVVAFSLFLLPQSGRAQTRGGVVPVGQFTNITQDAEHCFGYEVDLWRSGDEIEGVFRACSGLVGDRKTAILEHPSYNAQTGKISFETKVSLGSDYLGTGKQKPSQDVFSFAGRLGSNSLAGTLVHSDTAYESPITSKIPVRMRRNTKDLPSYRSLEEWHSKVTEKEEPANAK
jgi:hypothetical protein